MLPQVLITIAVIGIGTSPLCSAQSVDDAVDSSAEATIDFNRDVRPLFNEHCVACHGGVKQAGDLSFVYEDSVSYVVEPGDSDASAIIDRVLLDDDDESRMPPPEHGRALTEEEIDVLRRWIDAGAKWGKHWSYEELRARTVPVLNDDAFSRGRLDKFVLAKMRDAGLEPNDEADATRWFRRVALDLTGLPPTIDEVDLFKRQVQRSGEAAFGEALDRLLASPGFGQRWASVWLDVVRYADSRGLGLDSRRNIWQYRDWVVRAFNRDLPYDQFTVKQLAGDLIDQRTLDDLLATACHRSTQTNEEGGTDDETFRTEAVMDRVNTTWQTWMGLSFGCVQCHSHPYDPIEHDEYYQFLAFFNNSVDSDLGNDAPNFAFPLDPDDFQQALELDRQIEAKERQIWELTQGAAGIDHQWQPWNVSEATTNNSTKADVATIAEQAGYQHSGYQTVGTVAKNTKVVLEGTLHDDGMLTAVQFTGLPKDTERAKAHSEWGYLISFFEASVINSDGAKRPLKFARVAADESHPILNPNDSLNSKTRNGAGPYSRIHYPRKTTFVLEQPTEVSAGERLEISLTFNGVETGAFPLVAHRGYVQLSSDPAWTDWLSKVEAIQKELDQLNGQRRRIRSTSTPVMSERPEKLKRPSFVFDRGNQLTKTDPVSPGTPGFLPDLERVSADNQDASRLDLANWIVGPQNPLTARVAVNRVWSRIFGVGLVATEEDFGIAGESPTHPELLDDLAYRFQFEMDWSVKQLLREILISSVYRQSSAASEAKLAIDPSNRWLSRGPRTRLPAETIRDQALAIAGLLSETLDGPPVHPPIPTGIWNPFNAGDRWRTPENSDPDRYRRTLYTYMKRTIPYPIMASFDAPSREFCSVRRLPSNSPTQALMTLNDTTFVEAANAFAERMNRHEGDLETKLRHGFRLATCRVPNNQELQALLELSYANSSSQDPAGFISVATVLLNLDEVLCK
ncbi:PSD1 and planctomycete cytochrome C domain-containing protein [Rhodopirellula sp. MGV]|uniref:PSD1 and planctomycete cytochrome C domain-containing protein n=1 Tax=Rhodopirellula sp. MGV TaxID=2023130 RepID=UPI0013041A48|nr:PSD1 and planctomycete cytochrome C domain-containing protein [Rhodopirellula sp. MGV]